MKNVLFLLLFVLILGGCGKEGSTSATKLSAYLSQHSDLESGEVIACAASDKRDSSLTQIFFYPITGASDMRYFESNSLANKDDFSAYQQRDLQKENAFGGKLQRFIRPSNRNEVYGIVTYKTEGKLHKSNPIRLKQSSRATRWSDLVDIDQTIAGSPKFKWKDGNIKDNKIYFQVISEGSRFISGTYTTDKEFQYYDTSNVVLHINTEDPEKLEKEKTYTFTLMAVSEDNWVNLVVQKHFVLE